MKYEITLEEINKIIAALSDCPLKYSLPVVDLLRKIMTASIEANKVADQL